MPESLDPLLVRRAIAGDRGALEALWTGARRFVAAVLVAAGARRGELQDLLQETACGFTKGIVRLREPAALHAWLRALALNALRASHRRRGDSALATDPVARADDSAERADEVGAVWSALDELPAEQREALVLKAVEGLSQRAIADALGVPETTIETRLARARRALRSVLARGHGKAQPAAVPRTGTPCATSRQ